MQDPEIEYPREAPTCISNEALVDTLPGFSNAEAIVNGVRLHYVVGGSGRPLLLLPGWPQTWWAYHKVMPDLAKNHRVYAVDFRGMGTSDKPEGGYDKKTIARDLSELVLALGHSQVDVVGHDIGAMVAYAFAANHPRQVRKLVLLDVGHPSPGYLNLRLLPARGALVDKVGEGDELYLWWFALLQIRGLTEELLEGRAAIPQAWVFRYLTVEDGAIDARDRAVYANAYNNREAIRGSNGWYQSFAQDIEDFSTYGPLDMPVLGLAGPGFVRLKASLDAHATDSDTVRIRGCGHFIPEEAPHALLENLRTFLL